MSANSPSDGKAPLPLTAPSPQAVPQWIALAAPRINDLSARSTGLGVVSVIRRSDSNNATTHLADWVISTPNGDPIDTTGTTTQGLQEAINYAAAFGYDLIWDGGPLTAASSFGAYDGQDASIVFCTTTVTFPPLQKGSFIIRSVSLISIAAVGVRVNSCLLAQIDLCWGGQVVMGDANADALVFSPTDEVPQDNLFGKGIGGSCHFRTGSLVVPTGGTGRCVVFEREAGNGPIAAANTFEFSELNGGNIAVLVTDGATAFTENYIRAYQVHGQASQCFRIGQSDDGNTGLIHGNQFIADLHPNGAGAIAFDTWAGQGNYANLSIDGTCAIGIKLEATSDGLIVDCPRIGPGAVVPVSDLSTSHGNIIRGHSDFVDVDRSNADQVGIATATWTKVAFDTINSSTNGTWNNALYRWTPGLPGLVQISAQVKWVTTTDQSALRLAIYKNGSLMRGGENLFWASGIGGGQGAFISRVVRVDLGTDYFEIWARQDTGVNQDISGDVNETWANFTRLPA